jgi:hypothetical protein
MFLLGIRGKIYPTDLFSPSFSKLVVLVLNLLIDTTAEITLGFSLLISLSRHEEFFLSCCLLPINNYIIQYR